MAKIVALREEGVSFDRIAVTLKCARSYVRDRWNEHEVAIGAIEAPRPITAPARLDAGPWPLPPGHPFTWGAIAPDLPWP